ncbi:MAG: AtpZ/AtpI family protein [Chloroflexi bacterium]|nr:AtpZ/AtpI family protein [Chloroflexota bacterium]
MTDQPPKDWRDVWSAAWADALRATSLGWDLAVPICGGGLLGYLLDRYLDTGYVVTAGLLFLGVMIGFYNVLRKLQAEIARDRRRAENEEEERKRQ